MPADILIRVENVRRRYRMGDEEVWALDGVSLEVFRGEYLSIMGPSGSGKSTLFNMVGGLDLPTQGRVTIDGHDLQAMDAFQLAYLRCHSVGYIFQSFNLIAVMSALENVMLPMTFGGVPDPEARSRAAAILERVGLGHRLHHRPDQLSGGQQQRVAIARALANAPQILLADEPTGNLDLRTGEEIIGMLGQLCREDGVTVISATHDHKMLAASDRIVYLDDGRIAQIRRREEMDIEEGEIGEM